MLTSWRSVARDEARREKLFDTRFWEEVRGLLTRVEMQERVPYLVDEKNMLAEKTNYEYEAHKYFDQMSSLAVKKETYIIEFCQ